MSARVSASSLGRLSLRVFLLSSTMIVAAVPLTAQAQAPSASAQQAEGRQVQFNVPAQELDSALTRIADQGGVQILFGSADVKGVRSGAASGTMTVEQALSQALTGTGFGWRYNEARTITIARLSDVADNALRLGPVRVEGTSDRVSATGNSAATKDTGRYTPSGPSNTASRLNLTFRETPQSLSVITRQRMDDQALDDLGEVLQQTAGIIQTSTVSSLSTIYGRGFTADTLQTDGLSEYSFSISASLPDMAMFDRVEVLRGAAGLMQGSGNPAGSINLIRKRPTRDFRGSAILSAGSWESYRVEGDVSGPLNSAQTIRFRVVGAQDHAGSFIREVKRDRQLIYGAAAFDLGPRATVTIGGNLQYQDDVPSYVLPRLSDGTDARLPRSTFLGRRDNFDNKRQTNLFAEIEHGFSGGWNAKATISRSSSRQDIFLTWANGAVSPTTGLVGRYDYGWWYDRDLNGFDVSINGPVRLFGRDHQLSFGANGREAKTLLEFSSFQNLVPINPYTYDNSIKEPRSVSFSGNPNQRSLERQAGAFVTAKASISDQLSVLIGGRVSFWETNNATLNTQTGAQLSRTGYKKDGVLTPYVGAVFDLTESVSLYASYTDTFQPQAHVDRRGDILTPVTGSSYEAGVKSDLAGDRLTATLALFRIDQNNTAQPDLTGPSLCPYTSAGWVSEYCHVAAGKVRSEGVEAELNGEFAPGWNITASYTYNQTQYIKDYQYQGRVFSNITPRHLFRIYTNYQLPGALARFNVGAGLNYQSKIEQTSGAITVSQGGYALVSLNAGYKISDRVSLIANVNNLFDVSYYRNLQVRSNLYGEPRSFTLRAAFSF